MTRRASRLFFFIAIATLAVWRGACVLAGPDIDTDAYAHHMIARAIVADWRDLAVHWVWLPLFHYAQVPLVVLGGTMQFVRWLNVLLTAVLPLLVFAYVRRSTARGSSIVPPDATAMLAAVIVAACPIVMQMGTTAQPEPLFALLIFGVAVSFQEDRPARTAAMLGAGVLLRYEAWACLVVIAIIVATDWRRRERRRLRSFATVLVPASLIIGWAVLRRPVDGRWFGFLGQTREFATGATAHGGALNRGVAGLVADAAYYPLVVPFRVMGPVLPLAAFGMARTIRQQGWRFVSVLSACLGFVSLAWVWRSTLGLDRHFVVVVPLYAICAAQGVAAIADGSARLAARLRPMASRSEATVAFGRTVARLVAGMSLAGMGVVLTVWMGFWRASIERGFPERAALGEYLRSLPATSTIFCDDATIEILSGLDRRRFDRHWVDDPRTWELVASAARAQGIAYVATWQRKFAGHESAGPIVFRSGGTDGDPASGVGVMRVEGALTSRAIFR